MAAQAAGDRRGIRKRPRSILRVAAAFRKGARVSIESQGYFVRLGHAPPKPDLYLDEIKPLSKPFVMAPKLNQAYNGGELSIRDRKYTRGVGAIAPAFLLYVQPEWDRFVALAGIDDDPYRQSLHAWYLGMHASVQFQVYLDGQLASESPVMRIAQEPWPFDGKIPDGSRRINLVITDAGSRSMLDLGDWLDAGFVSNTFLTFRFERVNGSPSSPDKLLDPDPHRATTLCVRTDRR